jgi:cytochrome c553
MKTTSGSKLAFGLAVGVYMGISAWAQSTVPEQDAQTAVRKLVLNQCFVCHGLQGESASDKYPRLAGLPGLYIEQQLLAFQSGERPSETMIEVVRGMSRSDMQALGRYFEGQGLGARTTALE